MKIHIIVRSLLCITHAIIIQQEDTAANGKLIETNEMVARWRSGSLELNHINFSFAWHHELLSLPKDLLIQMNDEQFYQLLRPGRVPYDEFLLVPPAINYMSFKVVKGVSDKIYKVSSRFGIPFDRLGYALYVRQHLDPWTMLNQYTSSSLAEIASVLEIQYSEDSPLWNGTHVIRHSALYNVCQVVLNANQLRPLPNRLQMFVESSLLNCYPNIIKASPISQCCCDMKEQESKTKTEKEGWFRYLSYLWNMGLRFFRNLVRLWKGPGEYLITVHQSVQRKESDSTKGFLVRIIRQWLIPMVQSLRKSSLALIPRPVDSLARREVSLADPKQSKVWSEARRRSAILHALLISLAFTEDSIIDKD